MINYNCEILILHYCREIIVLMKIIFQQKINRVVKVFVTIIVSSHFNIMIFVRFRDEFKLSIKNFCYFYYTSKPLINLTLMTKYFFISLILIFILFK